MSLELEFAQLTFQQYCYLSRDSFHSEMEKPLLFSVQLILAVLGVSFRAYTHVSYFIQLFVSLFFFF